MKEDTASPTVSLEALMLSIMINAFEGRDVATVDILGAFMQTRQPGNVHIQQMGAMVKLLIASAPGIYDEYVVHEKGQMVLYAKLNKALYGTVDASYLFWQDLTHQLNRWSSLATPMMDV